MMDFQSNHEMEVPMSPTVIEILSDHVSLEVSCIDRIYVNGYVPKLQTSGQLVYFLSEHLGNPLASPAVLGQLGNRFRREVDRFVEQEKVPRIQFRSISTSRIGTGAPHSSRSARTCRIRSSSV